MQPEKLYLRQDSLFDSKWIDKVEEYAKDIQQKKLVIQDGKQTERDSTGCFFTNDWLQKDLANVINETNKVCNWNFKLTKFEDFQYTSYDKKQHYNWHTDTHSKPYADGMMRKVSFSLLLNDNFKGGEFAICEAHPDANKSVVHRFDNVKPGTIIVFYSGLWHKVYPIKSGIRKSLVGWTLGPMFQ
jgi:PKHD-type hydroxylase|tara:strand:- start:7907 stop:8464 length:558 start_codon:yes stop_codon:yes gene_type:complete